MPSPGRSDSSTCPRAMRTGRAVTSSANPSLVRVRPQAICGSAAAICIAAAQAASLGRAAHAPELDGFQARPARGTALVVATDIVERVNAFIGADGDVAR